MAGHTVGGPSPGFAENKEAHRHGNRKGETLRLRGTTHLLFAGVTTEVCVQTTMREANDRGYDSLLIEDATESYFPEFKRAAMDMIRARGAIVGWTATCD